MKSNLEFVHGRIALGGMFSAAAMAANVSLWIVFDPYEMGNLNVDIFTDICYSSCGLFQ